MLDDDASEFSPGAGLEEQAVSAIAGVPHVDEQEPSGSSEDDASRLQRVRRRFSTTLRRAQERAEPVIEQRGFSGMFILCFAPTPLSTAGAYVGGLVRFGFTRYLLASFAAKYLLAGVIVVLALTFSSTAEPVRVPELNIPVINVTLFDDGVPGPGSTPGPGASPGPAGSPGPTSSAD